MSTVRVCHRCRKINAATAENCSDCGALLRPLASEVQEVGPVEDPRRCPECDVPMHSGQVTIQVPVLGWSLDALLTNVIFRLRGSHDWTSVFRYGQIPDAARCPQCGGVWASTAAARQAAKDPAG